MSSEGTGCLWHSDTDTGWSSCPNSTGSHSCCSFITRRVRPNCETIQAALSECLGNHRRGGFSRRLKRDATASGWIRSLRQYRWIEAERWAEMLDKAAQQVAEECMGKLPGDVTDPGRSGSTARPPAFSAPKSKTHPDATRTQLADLGRLGKACKSFRI